MITEDECTGGNFRYRKEQAFCVRWKAKSSEYSLLSFKSDRISFFKLNATFEKLQEKNVNSLEMNK